MPVNRACARCSAAMPELPEVERAARELREAIVGATIERVELLHPSLRKQSRRAAVQALAGARVRSVERRGKHQLVHLDDGRVIHVHFRLNGEWLLGRAADPLPRFARAVMRFAGGMRVVLDDSRALSTLRVHAAGAPPKLALGPEPMDPDLTVESLRAAFARRRAPIKVVLLDQRVIAGIGNIYASEALWEACIDPRAPACDLRDEELTRLLAAVRFVIERATGARYFVGAEGRFSVYDRRGQPCPRCGATIVRLVQSGRSTYFCPRCQRQARKPRRARSRTPARRTRR